MDTPTSLKTESLGNRSYGNFTLRDFIEVYIRSAEDFLNSQNEKTPTFQEYAHNLRARLSERFGLSQRGYYLLRPIESYGVSEVNSPYKEGPVQFFSSKRHLRVRLSPGVNGDIYYFIETALKEIGPEMDRRLTEVLLTKRPAPIQHPRIASFEDWFKTVMQRH